MTVFYLQVRPIKTEGASGIYMETAANACLGWPANICFENPGRNVLNGGFYINGRQVGEANPLWSFVLEEDACRDLDAAAIGVPSKDEDGEDMEDASSGAEDCSIQR